MANDSRFQLSLYSYFLLMGAEKVKQALQIILEISIIRTLYSKQQKGGAPCQLTTNMTNTPFELTSKRRKGFPSETQVKRGIRIVHGDKYLEEKLGRNDPCPCGSGHRF